MRKAREAIFPYSFIRGLKSGGPFFPQGDIQDLPSGIHFQEAKRLYDLVRRIKPKRTLETGFALGVSTIAIAQALEDNGIGEHCVIDPFQENYSNQGLTNVQAAGLSHRVTFFREFPEKVMPFQPNVDFIFIDSSHLFDLTILEFVLGDKILNTNGIMGFHDLWMPALRKVVSFILKNRAYRLLLPRFGCRKTLLGRLRHLLKTQGQNDLPDIPNLVFLKKGSNDSRDWKFFEAF